MATARDIRYINKDFSDFRSTLINYAKTYFPNTYTDFSPSSPGMMFIEMSSYVGDVLAFYQENQVQETYTQYARRFENLYNLAYMMGYKPKVTGVAMADIDFYQTIPATGSNFAPDFNYALYIEPNAQIGSATQTTTTFLTEDSIDFTVSSSQDPTNITVYAVDNSNNPILYLLKKTRQAISATVNTLNVNAGATPVEFFTTVINAENIIGILDITDENGNIFYEVPYLAEEMVYDSISNTNPNDPNTYLSQNEVPYLLKLKQTQRRFATRFIDSGSLQLQFGAGTTLNVEEEIVPNSDNVGLGLPFEKDKLTTAYSPTNFIFTPSYGIAPTGNLTVRYLTGGGVVANLPANDLIVIRNIVRNFVNYAAVDVGGVYQSSYNSLAVSNPRAASGGSSGDTVEELRQNIISNFNTQYRAVTSDDYLVRALSMPPKYGKIAKAYAERSKASDNTGANTDLYILAFNSIGTLTASSLALKKNIQTYLSQFRVVGDSVAIKDAFVINIGIDFEIIILPNFNKNDVLRKCILEVQRLFNIGNWQINEPIILKDITVALDVIEGVQTVKNVFITNKVGGNYSSYAYDVEGATISGVVYPSIDPMIFEVKYPNIDIKGKIVNL